MSVGIVGAAARRPRRARLARVWPRRALSLHRCACAASAVCALALLAFAFLATVLFLRLWPSSLAMGGCVVSSLPRAP
eukprot:5077231-Alexandrium_andersonii.AAC.1